jgi:hypothetical protein
MVTINGHPQFKDLDSYQDAYEKATRWGKGMCKHKDPKSHSIHVEVKRDTQSEREFDDEYSRYKDGRPQVVTYIHD